ncbi:MAG: hypothetical protein ACYTDU_00955 [Planctomycetota bacterium]
MSQFGLLDEMQAELLAENVDTRIRMSGVNMIGADAGNPDIVAGRSLPWLQDTLDQDVWSRWGVAHFDVIVVDDRNQQIAAYNLSDHDLADPANYAELKALLRDVARE